MKSEAAYLAKFQSTDQMDQVLIYKMGTALMSGEIERRLRQARGRERKKERERGQKERKEGEGSLLPWLVQPQYGIAGLESGRVKSKALLSPNMSWLLAYPCKGLAVPTKVSS